MCKTAQSLSYPHERCSTIHTDGFCGPPASGPEGRRHHRRSRGTDVGGVSRHECLRTHVRSHAGLARGHRNRARRVGAGCHRSYSVRCRVRGTGRGLRPPGTACLRLRVAHGLRLQARRARRPPPRAGSESRRSRRLGRIAGGAGNRRHRSRAPAAAEQASSAGRLPRARGRWRGTTRARAPCCLGAAGSRPPVRGRSAAGRAGPPATSAGAEAVGVRPAAEAIEQ